MQELRVLAERWRVHYNTVRPHSSLGYRPPAPEAWQTEINTGHGEVETATRFPLLHTPPRLRRDYQPARCAKLTISLVQKNGHASPTELLRERSTQYISRCVIQKFVRRAQQLANSSDLFERALYRLNNF
jgi:hypothetical protein